MADRQSSTDTPVYDLLGVGFGPANLSLAAVLEESGDTPEAREHGEFEHLFLESKPGYAWHPNMLLEDSLLQITVLKDLVTIHNPMSELTFLNYLKEKGRLFDWLNLRELYPTRLEFNDYLGWAAGKLDHRVRYNHEVEAVHAVEGDGGEVEMLRVVSRNGATGESEEHLARNVVVATGGRPVTPQGIDLPPDGKAFHSHHFLRRLAVDFSDRQRPYRFVVVGAGQSGAELFLYLIRHYPYADVTACIRQFSYKPADGSAYTNSVFFPEWIDFQYDLPAAKRRAFFDSLRDVNYAVIDEPLINEIYKTLYRMKVAGTERARILNFQEMTALHEDENGVRIDFHDRMREKDLTLEVDGAVICTGYEWPRKHPVLDPISSYLVPDDIGGYQMERDYSIRSRPGFKPRVYLQGYSEDTHGISETVLSLLPIRAEDIRRSLYSGGR